MREIGSGCGEEVEYKKKLKTDRKVKKKQTQNHTSREVFCKRSC